MEQLLEKAIYLAIVSHKGQLDKQGHIYILHPIRVMNNVDTIEEKIVAILHDIIEDTDMTIEELVNLGYPNQIINALTILTRDKNTKYFDYIENIKTNKLALKIKIADLNDNLRKGCPNSLQKRYKKALNVLENKTLD